MDINEIESKDIEKVDADKFIVTPPTPTTVTYSLNQVNFDIQLLNKQITANTTRRDSLVALKDKLMAK